MLRTRPWSTPAMMAVFADATVIRYALAFEAALSRAQAAESLIPARIASSIVQACEAIVIDAATLADEATLSGTLAIPLVARLRAALTGEAAASVHKGATSQDVADTVLMLQARDGAAAVLADLHRATTALARHAASHGSMPAIGRTLLQDALPIGFGLRIAQWMRGVDDAARRLREEAARCSLQFGGAAGTRAGLGMRGAQVAARMADDLGLATGEPWQARRGDVAALAAAIAVAIGALAKMARDISLLAQNAVGEAREPTVPGRGGSSAMAHKRNPTGCQVALSAALRAPGLVATILAGLPQEEERGLGGWQAEAPALTELFLLAAGAAEAMAVVAEGLEIDAAAIARNLAAADVGTDIGESVIIIDALLVGYRG